MADSRRSLALLLLALLPLTPGAPAFAQDVPAPAAATAPVFTAEQLEQMVAPVALYPDTLLTQVLMASTYPLEIVQAERWSGSNKSLTGSALDEALKSQDWDASVKSLCHVPDVLAKMSANLDWTQDLGDAFLAQRADVMDTVQRMRGKAKEAGNLDSSENLVVKEESDSVIIIESPDPEVIYVPTYSPTVVYGPGWYYPTWYYPPMYYPPRPGYPLVGFGVGVIVGGAIWGNCNWGGSDINIDIDRYNNFNRNTSVNPTERRANQAGAGNRASWDHDPSHRKGVSYPSQDVAKRFGGAEGASHVSRDQARGRSPGGAQVADRSGQGGSRASAGQTDRSRAGAGAGSRDTAMSGSRSGSFDRAASSRGSMSRGTSSFGGGMRGGGGRRR